MPEWKQECDDYKLVLMDETLAAGFIVGLGGQQPENNDPKLENTDFAAEIPELPSSFDPDFSDDIKDDQDSTFNAVQTQPPNSDIFGIDDQEDMCPALVGNNKPVTTTTTVAPSNEKKGFFAKLLKAADKFLQKFNIRRLKFGTIIEFLDKLGMDKSKKAMAKVMITIKELIENKPCVSPHEMTEDQLMNELMERGKDSSGSREEMLARLLELEQSCPLMSFTMPRNVYCTFDSYCLGVECCINVKLAIFLKVFKFWARFDPCADPMQFVMAFDKYNYTIKITGSLNFDGFENELKTGIKIDLMGGIEVVVKYSIIKGEEATLATFGVGFCSHEDMNHCILFVNLLDNAILPIPTCKSDGSIIWPKLDFSKLFDKEALVQRIKAQGKALTKLVVSELINEFLKLLNIHKEILLDSEPSPRPEKMTDGQIKAALMSRNLPQIGDRATLNSRLLQSDLSCTLLGKNLSLHQIAGELGKILYYAIQDDCMRLDAWADITVPLLGQTYTKTLRAYIELDPCSFVFHVAFEGYSYTKVLLSYEWGKDETEEISHHVIVKYKIDRNVEEGVFVLSFGLKICPGDCFLDDYFLKDIKIPIPLCGDFVLPGGGTFSGLLQTIGGKMTEEAFELVLKKFDLDMVFKSGPVQLPPGPSSKLG
eukprot:XP_019928563.1 PREDICTED: uncharacterized protein LOC105342369 [Crassostrea gigas]